MSCIANWRPARTFHHLPRTSKSAASPAEESEVTGAIVESAFFPDGAPEAFRGLIAPLYQMENALAFVATIDGAPSLAEPDSSSPNTESLPFAERERWPNFADADYRRLSCGPVWQPRSRRM